MNLNKFIYILLLKNYALLKLKSLVQSIFFTISYHNVQSMINKEKTIGPYITDD